MATKNHCGVCDQLRNNLPGAKLLAMELTVNTRKRIRQLREVGAPKLTLYTLGTKDNAPNLVTFCQTSDVSAKKKDGFKCLKMETNT